MRIVRQRPEIWKPIPRYEDTYVVSSFGRVKRVSGYNSTFAGRILKNSPGGGGYLRVTLTCKGIEKMQYVHRLVMLAFVGECPVGQEVCHGEEGKFCNKLSNLRYGTRESNYEDARQSGAWARGSRHPRSKLTEASVMRIKELIAGGIPQRDIAKGFNVCVGTVNGINRGRSWLSTGMKG